jgi:hypothetical protein
VGVIERSAPGVADPAHGLPRQRMRTVRAKAIVMACGAIERPLVFGGNDKPAVMLSSAVGAYVNRYAVAPGRRALFCVNNDAAYADAMGLAQAGAQVQLVDLRPTTAPALLAAANSVGITVHHGSAVTQVRGFQRANTARIEGFDSNTGRIMGGAAHHEVDLVAMSGGWTPTVHLSSHRNVKPVYRSDISSFVPGAFDRAQFGAGSMVGEQSWDGAIASGQFLPPGSYSHAPDLAPPTYDVARAKKLLAEAGFPNGFRITLHSSNDRYLNDAKIVQAIGQMWTRIGVRTAVEAQPWTTFIARAGRQEFSAFLQGWGTGSGEGSNPLRNLTATPDRDKGYGASNRGRYANPEMDRVLDQAMRELDDAKREALLRQATRMVFEDVGILPLHIQKNTWAIRKGLAHDARADELTRAQDVRPAGSSAVRSR